MLFYILKINSNYLIKKNNRVRNQFYLKMDTFKVPSIPDLIEQPKIPLDDAPQPDYEESKSPQPPQPNCPYLEPKWSAFAPENVNYSFEILKNGVIVANVEQLQTKKYWTFGRFETCDIVMEHPSISRFHAILQYRPSAPVPTSSEETDKQEPTPVASTASEGWYIYDLGSTHGTFLNKRKIPIKTYIKIHVGYMIKLGGSSRSFILQGPSSDADEESELTITEMKEQKRKFDQELQEKLMKEKLEREEREKRKENEGVDWGMSAEDADEETDLSHNPFAQSQNEELFLDDPKKTLRGFFEREGLDMEYRCDEMSAGSFVCRVELPIDDAFGRPIMAEVSHKGKKKEAVVQCALEACRILDRHGVLRQANHEPLRKKKVQSSSDEDDYLDRTGDVEKKRQKRVEKADNKALTYDELLERENEINEKMAEITQTIQKYHDIIQQRKEHLKQDGDNPADLDEFVKNMSTDKAIDKAEIRKLRVHEQRLLTERGQVQRLIRIAKPVELPGSVQSSIDGKVKVLPLFGKRGSVKQRYKLETPAVNVVETEKSESSNPTKEETTEVIAESSKVSESPEKRVLGPTFTPDLIEKYVKVVDLPVDKEEQLEEIVKEKTKREAEPEIDTANDNDGEQSSIQSKKRRTRVRIRDKTRENVDFDDTEELMDDNKYSKWVPPQNQKGDGMTDLNEKFGY